MSLSSPFIHRPIATTLLTLAIALAGVMAYRQLPVSPLPQVDFPSIQVSASLPGASPETMASAVATPLERQFGRIAGVTEMSSTSSLGSTSITMVFELSRNIDAAGRDVQAAINAARGQLPANLPNNPSYRKVNPADTPVLILALTSDVYPKSRMYDIASSVLQQKLAQVDGIGQVNVSGGALPAVRVDVNPTTLNNMGLSLENVRTTLAAANVNRPKGQLADDARTWGIAATDQLDEAKEYQPLIVAYRNGSPVRLSDVAAVTDSVEDVRTFGASDGKPAVLLIINRQPGANIIATVDRVRALLPQFRAELPPTIRLEVVMDRTSTIRTSVQDVQLTLLLSIALVILVVFVFLRNLRSTLIPSVAVPVSLIGTFGVMYLVGYSIDNLSLMAMTIATGFVVDDAIVVMENITRYLEQGMNPMDAALRGAREIGFTVISMSTSLVAVFIPILLMGGIVGRLFREFAVVLSVAIAISMVVSLTTTPMMCARLLRPHHKEHEGRLYRAGEWVFNLVLKFYEITLGAVLRHPLVMILATLATVGLTAYLFSIIPGSLFPQQDTGRLSGSITADQDTSFQSLERLIAQYSAAVSTDPAVDNVIAFAGGSGRGGGGATNSGRMFVSLKPLAERQLSADLVKNRITAKTSKIPGGQFVLQANQDLSVGGRSSDAQFQFVLQGDSLQELNQVAPKVLAKIKSIPALSGPTAGVNSDQRVRGLQASLTVDRATAARLGITQAMIDNTLYDAFGQRQVSTVYTQLNQFHVVLEVDPAFSQNPDALKYVYVQAADGSQVPLSTIARYAPANTSLSVNHSSQFPSVTISFNLPPGLALSEAVTSVQNAVNELNLPATIRGRFAGTALAYQDTQASQMWLIIAALVAVYIVLGMLYESLIHPVTILSTIPSAGVGALLALLLFKTEFSVIALIGIMLLIGIVKKNAILMIDFAIDAERRGGMSPRDAIFQAGLLRFRPILMTTMAALLGGLPLALGTGTGSELRRPLGIAIVGGLIFSQLLTLYTTPVIYLYLDRFRLWTARARRTLFSSRDPHPTPTQT